MINDVFNSYIIPIATSVVTKGNVGWYFSPSLSLGTSIAIGQLKIRKYIHILYKSI